MKSENKVHLNDFDYGFNGTLDQRQVEEIISGNFVCTGEHLIIRGGSGTGKTIIAQALMDEMVRRGKSVQYITAPFPIDMLDDLLPIPRLPCMSGKRAEANYIDCDLLVVDSAFHGLQGLQQPYDDLLFLLGLRCEMGKSNVLVMLDSPLPRVNYCLNWEGLWYIRQSRWSLFTMQNHQLSAAEALAIMGVNLSHPCFAEDAVLKESQPQTLFPNSPVWHILYSGKRSYREVLLGQAPRP